MTIQYTKNLSSLLSLDLFPQCQLETNPIPQPSFRPIKVVTGSNLTEHEALSHILIPLRPPNMDRSEMNLDTQQLLAWPVITLPFPPPVSLLNTLSQNLVTSALISAAR